MKTEKVYKIKKTRSGRTGRSESFSEGTLSELIKSFSYTLEIGYSWNKSIKTNPKTITSFITNVNKAFNEKEAACYDRTHVELVK